MPASLAHRQRMLKHLEGQMNQLDWQLIATAPKDGSRVLLFIPGLPNPIDIGSFHSFERKADGIITHSHSGWSIGFGGGNWQPTHWAHLPPSPRDQEINASCASVSP